MLITTALAAIPFTAYLPSRNSCNVATPSASATAGLSLSALYDSNALAASPYVENNWARRFVNTIVPLVSRSVQ